MKPLVSIIIPAYNSERTISATLDSIRNASCPFPYEVLLVDDGSQDATLAIAKHHPLHPLIIRHPSNRGGGAARNTGISKAKGTYIICIDSDNLVLQDSLEKLVATIEETGSDGVVFGTRHFFWDPYTFIRNTTRFPLATTIDLPTLFAQGLVLDNFLYRADAYAKTSGYPEHHDLDTQCFEMRFLASGNHVVVSPEAAYLHRQANPGKSYFDRIYESGYFSLEYYLALEDVMGYCSDKLILTCMQFPVFSQTSFSKGNLAQIVQAMCRHDASSCKTKPQGHTDPTVRAFLRSIKQMQQGEYQRAFQETQALILSGNNHAILYYNLIRCMIGMQQGKSAAVERAAIQMMEQITPRQQESVFATSIWKQMLRKVRGAVAV